MSRNVVIEELREAISRGDIPPEVATKLMVASQVEIYGALDELSDRVRTSNGHLVEHGYELKNHANRLFLLETQESKRDVDEEDIAKANIKQLAADKEERTLTWPLLLSKIGWPAIMIIVGIVLTYIITQVIH